MTMITGTIMVRHKTGLIAAMRMPVMLTAAVMCITRRPTVTAGCSSRPSS